jgi:hypothetical protein
MVMFHNNNEQPYSIANTYSVECSAYSFEHPMNSNISI